MPTNRRRHIRRSHPPIDARLGGAVYTAVDWSLGGFAVRGLADSVDPRSTGTEITGYFGVAGEDIAFKFAAVFTRIDRAGDAVGFDFTALWPESADMLQQLFWRPQMVHRRVPPILRPRDYLVKALGFADGTRARWRRPPTSHP